jgi:hypothetical protein
MRSATSASTEDHLATIYVLENGAGRVIAARLAQAAVSLHQPSPKRSSGCREEAMCESTAASGFG